MPAPWPISRTLRGRAALRPPCSISKRSDGATTAASSISTTAKSSSRSNSIPGNGCFTRRLAHGSPKPRRAGSNHPGRPSFPTRAFSRCCGRFFRATPILFPLYLEDDPTGAKLGPTSVRKPLYSREGANVALITQGVTLVEQQGPYGAEGFIRQALAPLPNFGDQHPVLGSWLVDHTPCGLSIREDENPITGNTSRFLPHAILKLEQLQCASNTTSA